MNILSLDVSSVSTGWAVFSGSKLNHIGKIVISSKYSLQEKLYMFRNELNSLLILHNPDYVVVEETYLKNVKTLKVLMQFISVVNIECFDTLKKEPVFVSPNTVRSNFGLKTKSDVFKAVKSKYKVKLKNYDYDSGNDITDAVLQGLYFYQIMENADE